MFGTEKLKQLSEDMVAIMRKAPGVGLAAPQIGVGLKVLMFLMFQQICSPLTCTCQADS